MWLLKLNTCSLKNLRWMELVQSNFSELLEVPRNKVHWAFVILQTKQRAQKDFKGFSNVIFHKLQCFKMGHFGKNFYQFQVREFAKNIKSNIEGNAKSHNINCEPFKFLKVEF